MTPDINKVRVGLEHCSAPDVCVGCLYIPDGQRYYVMFAEALALLDLDATRATLAEMDKYVRGLKEAVGP